MMRITDFINDKKEKAIQKYFKSSPIWLFFFYESGRNRCVI